MKDIIHGDDDSNPQKILERKYLYLTLLLSHAKQMDTNVRDAADFLFSAANNNTPLDALSNVQLRHAVQRRLEPEVISIFQAFDRVDAVLDYSNQTELLEIVQKEMEKTENEYIRVQADSAMNRQEEFLKRKMHALELLLNHSGDQKSTETIHGLDALGTDLTKVTSHETLQRIRAFQLINACRSAKIKDELGYSLWTLPSTIPKAGRGCFLDGKVQTGSVVAFQPGQVWCKEHLLTNDPELMQHFDDDGDDEDCQISLRFDDYVIDSRQSPVIVLSQEGSMNPGALGHMVNHPPKEIFPNCHCSMLNYTERAFQSHANLVKYIPNTYARPLGWQSQFFLPEPVVMHGLCLVSRRNLENEELMYDYRLQSEQPPDWYSVVHYGDETLDKEQVVFFRDDWRNKK